MKLRQYRLVSLLLAVLFSPTSFAADSQCYGTIRQGRIGGAVKLPIFGDNFYAYSDLAVNLGRTYVHSKVRDVIVSAYASLQQSHPATLFVYGETGFETGGKFAPHKTHQNGLSVDFMVPVLEKNGRSVKLPTHAMNRYGYDIEFDKHGVYQSLTIDFEALAAHLVALHRQAKNQGIAIRRVLFDPELQPYLLQTRYGDYLRTHLRFAKRRSWVRHDEHYHVDFIVPCRSL